MKNPGLLKFIFWSTEYKLVSVILFLFLAVIVFCPESRSEYYRYVDKDGVVCFTDDLTTIPSSDRINVVSFRGITLVSGGDAGPNQDLQPDIPETEAGDGDGQASDAAVVALQQEKDRLDAQYQVLKNQRDALMLEGKQQLAGNNIKAYNDKVAEFNERMRAFEQEKNSYLDRVKDYYNANQ